MHKSVRSTHLKGDFMSNNTTADVTGIFSLDTNRLVGLAAKGSPDVTYLAGQDTPTSGIPLTVTLTSSGGVVKIMGGVALEEGSPVTSIIDLQSLNALPTSDGQGRPISYTGGAAPVFNSGALEMSAGAGAAVYAEVALDGPVTRMGCEFKFVGPDADAGAVCIIPWLTSKPASSATPDIPATGIHAVFKTSGWSIDYFDAGMNSLVKYASGSYVKKLLVGQWYSVEWARDGNNVTLRLPDGRIITVSDPEVSPRVGNFACFEIFRNGVTTSVAAVRKMWSSSLQQRVIPDAPLPVAASAIPPKTVSITPFTPQAIPQSKTILEADRRVRIAGGAAGKCLVRFSQYVVCVSGVSILYGCRLTIEDGTIYSDTQIAAVRGVYEGRVVAEMLVDVLYNQAIYAEWTVQATGASTAMYCSADKPALMTLVPVDSI